MTGKEPQPFQVVNGANAKLGIVELDSRLRSFVGLEQISNKAKRVTRTAFCYEQ